MKKTVWIATSNTHKLEEFAEMLGDQVTIKSFRDLKDPVEVEENGTTFEANALIKANALYNIVHEPVFADDSGIEVDAMDKMPGVYSARFLGEDTSYDIKNEHIMKEVEGKDRTARYVCVIAYVDENTQKTYRGEVEGEIYDRQLGSNGFGYDPIFYYPPYKTTLANVSDEKKHAISHRGVALRKYLEDHAL
ncbi:RdgB/HAM1 family non-canonical purine NTP pyrophosphatase [uncultured Dubosiella sp.]|uniref:RdgB/HAM1 family non-canonical purine NTP pyrophosphatase n=1 Tax=uncultured Dubosiella sp. TaxID=1937011 RepID=UPI0026329A59|nr:RdgB/HAM1 family non-canonical purine NTP pyrophosphatase [uncultured Dubosiella sp.]